MLQNSSVYVEETDNSCHISAVLHVESNTATHYYWQVFLGVKSVWDLPMTWLSRGVENCYAYTMRSQEYRIIYLEGLPTPSCSCPIKNLDSPRWHLKMFSLPFGEHTSTVFLNVYMHETTSLVPRPSPSFIACTWVVSCCLCRVCREMLVI